MLLIFSLFNKNSTHKVILLFTSLGISPIITSLITYYLLLIFPHKNSYFYLLFILTIYLLIYFLKPKELSKTIKVITDIISSINKFFLIFIILLLVTWQIVIINIPILGHDTFEYAIQGKIFFINKAITYQKYMFDPLTNFYYVGKHGFGYPIFNTLERFFNSVFFTNSDYYFRSISGYYWILIVLLQYYILSKKSKKLALLSTFTLLSSFGFTLMFAFYHLDSLRIFLLMLSIIFLLKSINEKKYYYITLFGIITGVSAFSHSINCIFSIAQIVIFFIFQKNLKQKILKTIYIVILFLIFGGIHYLLDIFWGTGWIL